MEHAESDVIGVPERWQFPESRVREPDTVDIQRVFDRMGDEVWRKASTAKEGWVGEVIADVLAADIGDSDDGKANRAAISKLIKRWEEEGILREVEPDGRDKHGNKRPGLVPGKMPEG